MVEGGLFSFEAEAYMPKTTVRNIRSAHVGAPGKLIYIGRAGKGQDGYFGNPHPIGYCEQCKTTHNREQCIEAYKQDFLLRMKNDPEFKQRILALKGHILLCFCAPLPCHGDVIAQYLDS